MKPQNTKPLKYYTMTPSVVVFRLMEHPVALLVLHYVLIRRKIYPKFRIADMAKQLNKDERTIRAAVKVLRKLELLVLKGKIGIQYYEFNEAKYEAYMRVNPFASGDAPSQKMGVAPSPKQEVVPSQKMGGVGIPKTEGSPLSKNEGVKSKGIEERESKETELKCGSQPPFSTAVAPVTEDLGEVFERYFNDGLKSQPPSAAAAAPKPEEPEDLAEKFESFFKGTALASTSSVSPPDGPQPAEGGVPVGVPSTAVAHCPDSTIIQSASGTVNGSGTSEPDGAVVSVTAAVIQGSGNGNTNAAAEHDSAGQS